MGMVYVSLNFSTVMSKSLMPCVYFRLLFVAGSDRAISSLDQRFHSKRSCFDALEPHFQRQIRGRKLRPLREARNFHLLQLVRGVIRALSNFVDSVSSSK